MERLKKMFAAGILLGAIATPSLFRWQGHQFRLELQDAMPTDQVMEYGPRRYTPQEIRIASMESLSSPQSLYTNDLPQDPVEAISDYADRLREREIEFIVVPVPTRPLVNAPRLRSGLARWLPPTAYNEPYDAFMAQLEHRGVTTLDLLRPWQWRAFFNVNTWVNRADAHWTNPEVVDTAKRLSSLIYRKIKLDRTLQTNAKWHRVRRKAAYGELDTGQNELENIWVRRIESSSAPINTDNPKSPVLLIGDSHVIWYNNSRADIVRQLTHELGIPVDSLPIVGGGASRVREELARRDWAEPGYLKKKRVIIWIWWMAGIYNEEWRIVPLDRFPTPRLKKSPRPTLSTDHVLMENGRGEAGLGHRWRSPEDQQNDRGIAWIRKPHPGTITFGGSSTGDLILDLHARRYPVDVRIELNGYPLGTEHISLKTTKRVRLSIPESASMQARNKLVFNAVPSNGKPPTPMIFGVSRIVQASTQQVLSFPFEMLPSHSNGFTLEEDSALGVGTSGLIASLRFHLAKDGDYVLRARLREPMTLQRQRVTIRVDENLVLRGMPITKDAWAEPSVPLGFLRAGDHLLELQSRRQADDGSSLRVDTIEIDKLPEDSAAALQSTDNAKKIQAQ